MAGTLGTKRARSRGARPKSPATGPLAELASHWCVMDLHSTATASAPKSASRRNRDDYSDVDEDEDEEDDEPTAHDRLRFSHVRRRRQALLIKR